MTLTNSTAFCDELREVLHGAATLVDMRTSAARVHHAMHAAIADKERAEKDARPTPRAPTAHAMRTAEDVEARLRALEAWTRLDALEARGTRLTVADVKRVLDGATLFVIQAQDYSTVSYLDHTDFMFEDPLEPLGYFHGDGDDEPVGVGGGSDAWYVADHATLAALGGVPPPR